MENLYRAMKQGELCLPWEDLQALLSASLAGQEDHDGSRGNKHDHLLPRYEESSRNPEDLELTSETLRSVTTWEKGGLWQERAAAEHEYHEFEQGQCNISAGVQAALENRELWKQFNSITNEMIITKIGRRMFPLFQVSLQGLKPLSSYSLLLEFKLADSHRWRFLNGEWQSIGGATSLYEQQLPEQRTVFIHPASPQTGRQWMKEKINFSKLKLSNKEDGKGKIKLNSLYRYQPCLHIVLLSSSSLPPPSPPPPSISTHIFNETQFIAVTAYQNEKITQMKIKYNPFAKAFLTSTQGGTTPSIRSPRASDSDSTSFGMEERVHQTDLCHALPGTFMIRDQPIYQSYEYMAPTPPTWPPPPLPPPHYTHIKDDHQHHDPNSNSPFRYHFDHHHHGQQHTTAGGTAYGAGSQMYAAAMPYHQSRHDHPGYREGYQAETSCYGNHLTHNTLPI